MTFALGGHGYSYDPEVKGKKNVCKNVCTGFGYYVEAEYQTSSVIVLECLTGRSVGYDELEDGFLDHIEKIINYHFNNDGAKLLITSNLPGLINKLVNNKGKSDRFKQVYALYSQHKDDIVIDETLFPKGGNGFKFATDQYRFAEALSELGVSKETFLDAQTEKEFSNPEIDFNKIISSSFNWFFNTGDKTTHYTLTPDGRRGYFFGRPEKKKYFGKATPDVCYSALFTKDNIDILDRLFEYCKSTRPNPLNYIAAGSLNYILSKEVGRMIDKMPGVFEGNKLMSPMKIATSDDPIIVEFLETGLGYRIKETTAKLYSTYIAFQKRNEQSSEVIKFVEITDKFYVRENNKLKIASDFTQNTINIPVSITSPHCIKPVRINLGVKYDVMGRNEFNAVIKDKIQDARVYLMLDFSNPAGCEYKLIVDTPDFTYLYMNSCANKRVYNKSELGRD